jgi:hypothetical protein
MLQDMHLDLASAMRIRRGMATSTGAVVAAVFMKGREG